jgi:uncharacterized membrane protein
MDSHYRSILKAISYRILGSAATMIIFFIFSKDVTLSVGAGLVDSLLKTAVYFAHERLWDRIPIGRTRPPEYEI